MMSTAASKRIKNYSPSTEPALSATQSGVLPVPLVLNADDDDIEAEADGSGLATQEAVERKVPPDLAGLRIDLALARMFPDWSRSRLQAWVEAGRVSINAQPVLPKQKVWLGDTVSVHPMPAAEDLAFVPEAMALPIVFEDDSIIVVNKPAGLVVHPGSGNWQGTLLNGLLHHAPALARVPRAGIVHRLDKDTTGLMVVAKTLEAQTDLVRQLQARSVRRIYLALVHGRVEREGEVDMPIGRDPRDRTRMATLHGGKPALTRYRVLHHYEDATLLECRLETGRTHQIRVHMHALHHALVGDPVYRGRHAGSAAGAARELSTFPRQALHATQLSFVHPRSRQTVSFEAAVPQDMQDLLDAVQ